MYEQHATIIDFLVIVGSGLATTVVVTALCYWVDHFVHRS